MRRAATQALDVLEEELHQSGPDKGRVAGRLEAALLASTLANLDNPLLVPCWLSTTRRHPACPSLES
jgi:hypothetical protein